MTSKCTTCGSTDIDVDRARGNAVCVNCGEVLEHSIVVNDHDFNLGSVGTFIDANDRGKRGNFAGFHPGIQRESLESTLDRGRKLVVDHAGRLNISQHCSELANGFYRMLVERRFTCGRRVKLISAACLYLACRNEQLPYMLLDFSDKLEETVEDLGKMYLKISNELSINPPTIDPSIYIERFSNRLQFGSETRSVAKTATRIVARMKRDWMTTGRRPFGICGAALIVASRIHGFVRNTADIIAVVGMTKGTINRRLREFATTKTCHLTVDQFYSVDLEHEHDPPSLRLKSRSRSGSCSRSIQDIDEEEIENLDLAITNEITAAQSRKHRLKPTSSIDISECLGLPANSLSAGRLEGITDLLEEASEGSTDPEFFSREQSITIRTLGIDPFDAEWNAKSIRNTNPAGSCSDDDDEELNSDLDDDEIKNFFLTPEEVKRKTETWNLCNAEFMEQRHKRRLEREEQGSKPKRQRNPKSQAARKNLRGESLTAADAIDKIIKEKKISNKINYDVLKDLSAKSILAMAE